MNKIEIESIGYIKSPYREKFGIPRQPGLVTAGQAHIILPNTTAMREACYELEMFSHLWIIFQFHAVAEKDWKPRVRPPRLGGNKSTGVFATRSPFRPNNLGLSCVELVRIDMGRSDGIRLTINSHDFLNGTPVLDIKPYLPYADSLPEARAEILKEEWHGLDVRFDPVPRGLINKYLRQYPQLALLIEQVLSQDPRPAYKKKDEDRLYHIRLYSFNITWQVRGEICTVLDIVKENKSRS